MAKRDTSTKSFVLRVDGETMDALEKWAADEFRSINGQIEYLLTECVRQHEKNGGSIPKDLDTQE